MTAATVVNSKSIWPRRTFATMLEHVQVPITAGEQAAITAKIASRFRLGPKQESVPLVTPKKTAPPFETLLKPAPKLEAAPPVHTIKLAALEVPSATRLKAIDMQRRQQLLVAHVNRSVPPGCQVLSWSILPKEIFQGDLGRFLLIACDFHTHGPENTLLLPSMPAGMLHFNLPRHPLVTSETHKADATRRVSQLRMKVTEEHARTALALQNGDLSQIFKSGDRQVLYRQELSKITRDIAVATFGKNIWDVHEKRFRRDIQAL